MQQRPLCVVEDWLAGKDFWFGLFSSLFSSAGNGSEQCKFRRTSVGVELCAVQVVDNGLDGRLGAVPAGLARPSSVLKLWGSSAGFSGAGEAWWAAHIFQFPPTKNLRAMMGNWFLRVSLRVEKDSIVR